MAKLTTEEVKLAGLAKKANQRLRQIEKDNQKQYSAAYEDTVAMYTNQLIQDDIHTMSLTKHGEVKFRTDIGKMTAEEKSVLAANLESFLTAPTSGAKGIKKRREKLKEIQKNFENKYGSDYSGAEGLEKVKRVVDDSSFYNRLRDFFDSDEAEEVAEDIDKGWLDPELVGAYLDEVEGGGGRGNLSELYQWATTTEDWETAGW